MSEVLANATYRSFNYPHHTASYYSLYRAARNHANLKSDLHRTWQWYLMRAANSTIHFGTPSVGVMDGTIFREVLQAVQEEVMLEHHGIVSKINTENMFGDVAQRIKSNMIARAHQFNASKYPYGSEFNFDTTGQEEVVVWLLKYAGDAHAGDPHNSYTASANRTVNHILSFMRSSPTWTYHGGSRRYYTVCLHRIIL